MNSPIMPHPLGPQKAVSYHLSQKPYTPAPNVAAAAQMYMAIAPYMIPAKSLKEKKLLEELEEIWLFVLSPHKGPIIDVYDYVMDLAEAAFDSVKRIANDILTFLDSTCMRGGV